MTDLESHGGDDVVDNGGSLLELLLGLLGDLGNSQGEFCSGHTMDRFR